MTASTVPELKRILTPAMVWGLGVGYVISGNYFGWNLGLEQGGTLGLAIATILVIIMYVTFTFSYAELSCAIPKAGGAFEYASRALGKNAGFLAGMSQNIEFIFAPPAIAFAIGSYMHLFFPGIPVIIFSLSAYVVFTSLNIYGIQAAAAFELMVTVIAVSGLILFSAVVLPHVESQNLTRNVLPNGVPGILAAIPFAIWFFLGIEGIANLAEETRDPRRTMSKGFLSALFTLIVLCVLTFTAAVGAGGWEAVVFQENGTSSDSPLPLAIQQIKGVGGWYYTVVIIAGLFGLVASFNGLMLAAGRSSFEFARVTAKSSAIGKINPRLKTPVHALLINMVIGMIALFTGRTNEIITLSVFGALTMYGISMVAVIVLRRREPNLDRPFRVPFYPVFPFIALLLSGVALVAIAVYNLKVCMMFLAIVVVAFGIFKFQKQSLHP